ncbi:MFS general substrate transporter [Xylariaceae sp. FL1019]|nr:MFS general substrate transporter [Xylariaceae sp. FL1019]
MTDANRRRDGHGITDDEGVRSSGNEDATSVYPDSEPSSESDHHDREKGDDASDEWDGETESNAFSHPPSTPGVHSRHSRHQSHVSIAEELIEAVRNAKEKGKSDEETQKELSAIMDKHDSKLEPKHALDSTRSALETQQTNSVELDRTAILADLLIESAPRLRHLASSSSIDTTSSLRSQRFGNHQRTAIPTAEQRHPGKPGIRLSKFHRPFEPDIEEQEEDEWALRDPVEVTKPDAVVSDEGLVTGKPLILLIIGLSLVVFLISIDRTIITTATPYITAEFKSTSDIGWYGSSYLLTACAFQPVYGRVFTLFHVKWSFLVAMFVFEIGSLISGFSPTSEALIIGRAIAGLGSAGILTGSFVIVATAVPLAVRPIYTAVVGLMFGVGATIGPLIGGVFTDLATWRWCFWINLPVGAVTIIVMFLVFHPKPHSGPKRGFIDRFIDLDIIGNVILLISSVMLFLALEFSLTGSAWSSAKIIGLLIGTIITAILFGTWLWWRQDGAIIPPAIINQRSVSAACLMAFFTYGALLIQSYFLPIWFQAILGYSAIQSGVAMIPYFVANALLSVFGGVFVSAVGYFNPPAIIGSAIATIGCGVLTLFHPNISTAQFVGYEILVAGGFGLSIQQGFTAVQTVLKGDDLAVGTAAVVASQSLGGALFISVGNTVFESKLSSLIEAVGPQLDGVDPRTLIEAGAIAFRDLVTTEQLPILINVYNEALHHVFVIAIPLAGLSFLACCCFEWRSVKPPPAPKAEDGLNGVVQA